MKRMHSNLLLAGLFAALPACLMAQRTDRFYLRSGNRHYVDSAYVEAEVDYRKALEMNPRSTEARFNLGNALLQQGKANEAMEQYEAVTQTEKDPQKLAKAYHNMGVVLQGSKQYAPCIEAYKRSLRYNPSSDETRYNLALAQHLLEQQQQQQQQNDQQDQQDKQDQQQQQQQNQQDQQDKQDKQDQQQKQQPQNQEGQLSKENAQQLLNAAMQDEQQTQEKMQQMQQVQGRKLDKDW